MLIFVLSSKNASIFQYDAIYQPTTLYLLLLTQGVLLIGRGIRCMRLQK